MYYHQDPVINLMLVRNEIQAEDAWQYEDALEEACLSDCYTEVEVLSHHTGGAAQYLTVEELRRKGLSDAEIEMVQNGLSIEEARTMVKYAAIWSRRRRH